MRSLYNLLFVLGFCLSSPYYFWKMWRRGNWVGGIENRFGRYSAKIKQAITNRDTIWLHAVSVGEVNICTQLIKALEPRVPNLKIIVSTTTSTGMEQLQSKLPSHIEKVYYPIDKRSYVERALMTLHPQAIVLVEAELWPNFLWRAIDRGTPLFLVNARLSEKSYRGYKRAQRIFRPIFQEFSGVGCQDQADANRLVELGFRPEAIEVVGNLKFDAVKIAEKRILNVRGLMKQLGAPDDALLLVGGSTHAGEEEILGETFLQLRKQFPNLFLVVVPRHFERGREAGRDLEKLGIKFNYRSEVTVNTQLKAGEKECLLVNTTGELKFFYEAADLIFVGKSLTAEGGQSPIEPGGLGKAMVFGPNMQNFQAISDAFVAKNGAIRVKDQAELEKACSLLLGDKAQRDQMGKNALQVVKENQGAIERTVDMIVRHLDGDSIFIKH